MPRYPPMTPPLLAGEVDCFRCDESKGQFWRPDPFNCHMFYICERRSDGGWLAHHVTCGNLFWDQSVRTCTRTKTGSCIGGVINPYTDVPQVDGTSTLLLHPSCHMVRCFRGQLELLSSCRLPSCVFRLKMQKCCHNNGRNGSCLTWLATS